ncbi:MAG: short chain dehydrogenase, partial [Moraxellaceae bacterium]|nr:short chain dehydrogenase [Moraxellaceae bacterium]
LIMADAAFALLSQREHFADTVNWLDEDVLRSLGETDFDHYANMPENAHQIQRDFYIGTF